MMQIQRYMKLSPSPLDEHISRGTRLYSSHVSFHCDRDAIDTDRATQRKRPLKPDQLSWKNSVIPTGFFSQFLSLARSEDQSYFASSLLASTTGLCKRTRSLATRRMTQVRNRAGAALIHWIIRKLACRPLSMEADEPANSF